MKKPITKTETWVLHDYVTDLEKAEYQVREYKDKIEGAEALIGTITAEMDRIYKEINSRHLKGS